MPILSKDQVLKILVDNQKDFRTAVNEELETRLHTIGHETSLGGYAANSFLSFVRDILPTAKFNLFKTCFRLVVDTKELTSDIIEAFEDIFFAHDAVFTYAFSTPENEKDWLEYRAAQKHDLFWRHDYYKARWNEHNSVLVVDKGDPADGKNTPYYTLVKADKIIAANRLDNSDDLEYFIFQYAEKTIAVYDDTAYTLYREAGSSLEQIEQNVHNEGVCPARYISPKSSRNFYLRESPISKYIGKFKYTLFWLISGRQFDLYGPFPINWSYETRCDYKDSTNNVCKNGRLVSKETRADRGACPKCGTKQFNGPGTHMTIREPDTDGDMRQPAGEIPRDIAALEYVTKKGNELKRELYASITGNLIEPNNNQAVNEKQVMSVFEARRKAMMKFASSVSEVREWADNLACKMRYGDSFRGSFISYGTDFYLFGPEDLMNMYIEARDKDLGVSVLNDIHDRYIEVKFRGNDKERQKALVTYNLDPFRHRTLEAVLTLYDKGLAKKKTLC